MILQHQKVHADRMILFLKAENCHVALGKHAMIPCTQTIQSFRLNQKKKDKNTVIFFFNLYGI